MALNIEIYEKFKNAFTQKCFQLIIEAYQNSVLEKTIQIDWNENDISSELHRNILLNPLRCKWKVSTNVEAYRPTDIPKVKGFADKFPRIDFRFISFVSSYEFEYFFEAKNLKQNNSALKRRYIDTGINSFISNKYNNGSLIGYLLLGKASETIEGINSLLKKDSRNAETIELKPNNLLKDYFESNHPNIGILKHLIFDFTK